MKAHIAVVGAGFSGAVLARELAESGKFKITVFEERSHVAGLCHTERDEETGVMVHTYGPHFFATDSENLWEHVNAWGKFERFENRIIANTARGTFSFPINLQTINQFFDKKMNPLEARDFLGNLSQNPGHNRDSLETKALQIMGKDLYQNFIAGFAKKIWGMNPSELPSDLLEESVIRLNYDGRENMRAYQGIPLSGYTEIVKRILDHHEIDVRLGTKLEPERKRDFDHLFWSGPMDGYFKYQLGRLNYQTMKFEKFVESGDYQGTAVMRFCEEQVPLSRIIEHKHLTPWETHEKTICFKEYAGHCGENDIPFYPLRTSDDLTLLQKYLGMAEKENNLTFFGRLGTYQKLEMDTAISEALKLAHECLNTDISKWPRFSAHPMTKVKQ